LDKTQFDASPPYIFFIPPFVTVVVVAFTGVAGVATVATVPVVGVAGVATVPVVGVAGVATVPVVGAAAAAVPVVGDTLLRILDKLDIMFAPPRIFRPPRRPPRRPPEDEDEDEDKDEEEEEGYLSAIVYIFVIENIYRILYFVRISKINKIRMAKIIKKRRTTSKIMT
jgi:hypothetical protein